jgi:hypothetical protein
MELESALPSLIVRLNHNQRQYALRILKLNNNHPVRTKFNKYSTKLVDDLDLDFENTSQISKNPTQMERILESISNIVDFSSLEPIRHFFFAPWKRDIPYKVRISLKPKDIEAKLHV